MYLIAKCGQFYCHNKNTRKFNISDIEFFDLFFKREKKDETC